MKKELTDLRNSMKAHGIYAYIVPSTDFHNSEYVNDYFKCREYVSGFTGSAGTLVVTPEDACLWTDGRYFLQAESQLAGSGIRLMKAGTPGVPTIKEYLQEILTDSDKPEEGIDTARPEINKDDTKPIRNIDKAKPKNKSDLAKPRNNNAATVNSRILGFDGRLIPSSEKLNEEFSIKQDLDLVGEIWQERPAVIPSRIYKLEDAVTGEAAEHKLERIRGFMKEKGAAYHLTAVLDEIAWIYNLRGGDIEHTPVFFSYALISEKEDRLYVMDEEFLKNGTGNVPNTTVLRPYSEFLKDIEKLGSGRVLLNESTTSCAILEALPVNTEIISSENPASLFKSIKNEKEVASTRAAHIRDGAAMVNFIYWIKSLTNSPKIPEFSKSSRIPSTSNAGVDSAADRAWQRGLTSVSHTETEDEVSPAESGVGETLHTENTTKETEPTEISVADFLWECRKAQGAYDLSFDTISAYGPNGAIVHYSPTRETDAALASEGFLLVDSGGQYPEGTTDITRTIALGPLTEDMKRHYTAVLKGHIALASASFPDGTTGAELDALARKPIRDIGLDYNHGTGHGVGHLLGCHEGPQTISPRGREYPILPGMINSDEPGIYIEDAYGIRLENEILCINRIEPSDSDTSERYRESAKEKAYISRTEHSDSDPETSESTDAGEFYCFEPITFCPFDKEAILVEMLTEDELSWLNSYHRKVFEIIEPLVSPEVRSWLRKETDLH